MTPEEQKLQAAIAAAMSLPAQPDQNEQAFPTQPVEQLPVAQPQAQVAQAPAQAPAQAAAPVQDPAAQVAAGQPVEGLEEADVDRDWGEVDKMLEESFEGRKKKKTRNTVMVNSVFALIVTGVLGSAGYWYFGSEKNQARVSSLVTDVKTAAKKDLNPKAIVESYEASLAEIEAHQKLIQEAGAGFSIGEEVVADPSGGTAENSHSPESQASPVSTSPIVFD